MDPQRISDLPKVSSANRQGSRVRDSPLHLPVSATQPKNGAGGEGSWVLARVFAEGLEDSGPCCQGCLSRQRDMPMGAGDVEVS